MWSGSAPILQVSKSGQVRFLPVITCSNILRVPCGNGSFVTGVQHQKTRPVTTASRGEACLEQDRRQQTRYGVRALVNFEWMDEDVPRQGQGITRDISPKGMFIYSEAKPPAKADVRVDVSFQDFPFTAKDIQMSAKGVVIRVESTTGPGSMDGFAILNRSYDLQEWAGAVKH
jgi:hypothetical protein